MNAALQSLMRDTPRAPIHAPLFSGLLAFLVVGAAGAMSFVILSSALIALDTGVADWVVNTVCYAGFIVPVYLMQRRYSFRSDVSHWHALPRYMAVQGMALLLAALFSFVIYETLALPAMISSALVIGLTSGVNFMVLRSWAFARTQWGSAVPA